MEVKRLLALQLSETVFQTLLLCTVLGCFFGEKHEKRQRIDDWKRILSLAMAPFQGASCLFCGGIHMIPPPPPATTNISKIDGWKMMRFPFEMVPFLGDIREFVGGGVCIIWLLWLLGMVRFRFYVPKRTWQKWSFKAVAHENLHAGSCRAFFGGRKKSVVKKIDKQTQSNKALKQRNQGECAWYIGFGKTQLIYIPQPRKLTWLAGKSPFSIGDTVGLHSWWFSSLSFVRFPGCIFKCNKNIDP